MKKYAAASALLLAAASPAAPTGSPQCTAAAAYSASRDGVSFLVMRDGKIVCEDYPASGGGADASHLLASGTKSFTGIMAAAAAQDGFLTLDEKVAATITEWQADPRKSKVTIRQLIGLISGMPGGAIGNIPTYADAVAIPLNAEPGTVFQYGPAPFQVFGELMKRKLAKRGVTADPLDYLTRRVLEPLGVRPAVWRRTTAGDPNMPAGTSLTARQWATVGEFMRQKGRWNGRQLVDAATLAELTHSGPVNPSYGISWWVEGARGSAAATDATSATVDLTREAASLPPGIFLAAGAGIQRLYVIPSAHLVVVRQAETLGRDARRARNQARRAELQAQGASPAEARAALWSDAAFLKLVLGTR